MVTSCRGRCTSGRIKTSACRHVSTVVRDTASRRAATATDTLGNSCLRCSSRTWAASLTRCSSSLPAAMSRARPPRRRPGSQALPPPRIVSGWPGSCRSSRTVLIWIKGARHAPAGTVAPGPVRDHVCPGGRTGLPSRLDRVVTPGRPGRRPGPRRAQAARSVGPFPADQAPVPGQQYQSAFRSSRHVHHAAADAELPPQRPEVQVRDRGGGVVLVAANVVGAAHPVEVEHAPGRHTPRGRGPRTVPGVTSRCPKLAELAT
jgi:hypothetical protein